MTTSSLLCIRHSHARDERIQFREADHQYIVDGDDHRYISVTTLIKSFFPTFDADRIIDHWMNHPHKIPEKYAGKTKEEIKQEWAEKGQHSASLGTLLHATIENFYNEVEQTIHEDIKTEFEFFMDFHKTLPEHWIPYRTEWYVFDEDYEVAGSIDMIYKDSLTQTYHIYDWKRTIELKKQNIFQRGFYPCQDMEDVNKNHYSLQLNMYKYILEKKYGICIESMNLICLHPQNLSFHVETVSDIQSKIKIMLEHYHLKQQKQEEDV